MAPNSIEVAAVLIGDSQLGIFLRGAGEVAQRTVGDFQGSLGLTAEQEALGAWILSRAKGKRLERLLGGEAHSLNGSRRWKMSANRNAHTSRSY